MGTEKRFKTVLKSAVFALLASSLISFSATTPARAAFQTGGLIANWLPSTLTGSSKTWVDSVNSNTLNLYGTTYNSANGGTLTFSGSGSGAFDSNSVTSFTNTVSMFFWINIPDVSSNHVIQEIGRSSTNTSGEEQFSISPTTGDLYYWDYDGTNVRFSLTSTSGVSTNTWHYVGYTKSTASTATVTLYIDGTVVGQTTNSVNVTNNLNWFALGEDYRDSTSYFNGKIGQASIWNTALTTSDVTNNMAATNGNYVSPSITSSSSSQSIYLTQPITNVIETNTGGLATYSVAPALPNGLTIDPSTGTIYGTPTVASPTTAYTVTATNNAGTATITFTLTVTQAGVVLTGPATISYRQAATIQATPNGPTTLVFFANGKRIPACVRIVSSGSMVTCLFKPALQGPNTVYATYSIAGITGQSNTISVRATPRGTTR